METREGVSDRRTVSVERVFEPLREAAFRCVAGLVEERDALRAENERLRPEVERLARENGEMRADLERVREKAKRLELERWRGREKVERQLAFVRDAGRALARTGGRR